MILSARSRAAGGRPGRNARALRRAMRFKPVLLAAAAFPLCQNLLCYPDFLGGFNFELQRLINTTLINAFDILVRNLLNL